MKDKLLNFMANEGMSVESLSKFEKLYDEELTGAAKVEILNTMKQQQEAEKDSRIDMQSLAEHANIRK